MFSVIIPLYNKEAYVVKTIQSVLNQTFHAFELIVVNDGSTDNSFAEAAKVKDDRIKLLNQENKGIGGARNFGIKHAIFNYVCFLDADDLWAPNHLQLLKEIIEKVKPAGIYANAYNVLMPNGSLKNCKIAEGIDKGSYYQIDNFFKSYAAGDPPINCNSVCIPKRVLQQIGLFDEKARHAEDTLTWGKIALNNIIVVGKQVTSTYNLQATARTNNPERFTNEIYEIQHFENWLKTPNLANEKVEGIKMLIARHLFVNLMSNIKVGNWQKAKDFAYDKRMNYFANKFKLLVIKVYLLLPNALKNSVLQAATNRKIIN